ncbi:hypothetical protein QYF61_011506 [Mycteria americana]|uniref:Uncharacterized protein n=1 Tax=Mycteria americana TaxID=33587 RepID=A0AAN7PEH5_MYCAM|nr:hypothetical protein QYF61_011506 [Mycteria americana]
MIVEIFSNLNDSMIVWFYELRCALALNRSGMEQGTELAALKPSGLISALQELDVALMVLLIQEALKEPSELDFLEISQVFRPEHDCPVPASAQGSPRLGNCTIGCKDRLSALPWGGSAALCITKQLADRHRAHPDVSSQFCIALLLLLTYPHVAQLWLPWSEVLGLGPFRSKHLLEQCMEHRQYITDSGVAPITGNLSDDSDMELNPNQKSGPTAYEVYYKKDIDILGWIQWQATKLGRGMENTTYKETLRGLGLFSLQKQSSDNTEKMELDYSQGCAPGDRGVRICERNNSADTKISEEGGGGGASGTRAEIPLQPVVKTMVRQGVALQPMEVHGRADIHLQPVEDPMPEQVDVPEGGCDHMESLGWSSLFLKDCTPWKGPTLEQFVKNCSLWEGPM